MVSVVAAAALVLAPAADASIYGRVLSSYQNHGMIPPCQFSSQQLNGALKSVDTHGAQYFADFTAAIQSALASRASGACRTGLTGGAPSQSASGAPAIPNLPVTAATSAGLAAPIVLMAVIAAAAALLGGLVGLARLRGWDPAWAVAWRHSWREAGYRVGATWAEFVDWLRSDPGR
jgi:hypothetical protein